ncbi:uncharacterized protein BJ171DRAFT_196850 [Polychytrium aggregatum]|uniref:uncharacterized protein n=1 Tax=Polychytrium aggregatum TaxID=110093 RepID=UPI0022FEBD83|nr:uncharacterized protein BJ171DRAFT_196850 [Polychytrium aggregatum]KAI9201868.1 hypothetical protein BJ171DRAFT_196850 [Polychytrium aggregatum]
MMRVVWHPSNNLAKAAVRYASHAASPSSGAAGFATSDPMAEKAQEWFEHGHKLWNEGDCAGALEAYEKSVFSKPTGDGYYNVANCYYSLGKHEKAISAWKRSLEMSPRADAHVNLANVFALVMKDADQAVFHYKEALLIEPLDGEIHYNYAVVLDSLGRITEAIEEYQLAQRAGIDASKNLRNAQAKLKAQELKDQEPDDKK